MNSLAQVAERPHLDAALQAAKWIDRARVETEHGIRWRMTLTEDLPYGMPEQTWSIHTGSAGVVLFLLELYGATGDERFLKDAQAAVDHLAATLPFDGESQIGLYHGIAGAAYVFELVHQAGGRAKDREAVRRCLTTLRRYVPTAEGKFFGQGNEIFYGRAGLGLTLLWLYRVTGEQEAFDLAMVAGNTVQQRARQHERGGMHWFLGDHLIDAPAFGYGDSGMAYFLAVLYQYTGERAFLETAIEAARYIQTLAVPQGDGYLMPVKMKDQDTLYLIDWYAGVIGIWRLFFQLAQVTRDPEWTQWVHLLARGGINGLAEPGRLRLIDCAHFFNGSSGTAQGYLDLHMIYGNKEYLDVARQMHALVLRDAVVDELGMRWEFQHPRVEKKYSTTTAFMNGAAGIGTWLLHLDGFEHDRPPVVTLPDSPFDHRRVEKA